MSIVEVYGGNGASCNGARVSPFWMTGKDFLNFLFMHLQDMKLHNPFADKKHVGDKVEIVGHESLD